MHCPHCDAPLPATWIAEEPGRCPTCRLIVGAGRSTAVAGDGACLSGAGTAAGVLAGAARREEAEAEDPALVAAALREAARRMGVELRRLRMLEYQQVAAGDPALPSLAVVLATFGTWKGARARGAKAVAGMASALGSSPHRPLSASGSGG